VDIGEETRDGAVVLVPRGRVDSATAKDFEGRVLGALNGGPDRLVIDFAELDYVSSAGLRVVLMGAKQAKAKGARLVLCGMKPSVREVFDLSGFARILEITPDREAALAKA